MYNRCDRYKMRGGIERPITRAYRKALGTARNSTAHEASDSRLWTEALSSELQPISSSELFKLPGLRFCYTQKVQVPNI